DKIIKQLADIWDELTYGLRRLCLCPSPAKRLVTVLVLAVVLGGANIYFVVSSIYNIGKRDAQKEFLEVEHIKELELPTHSNDSINQLKKQMYE
ncbi:hypothetical protein EZS27_043688, partial [termite gut metagenome]